MTTILLHITTTIIVAGIAAFADGAKKNGHKGLILVQPASWVKENLVLGVKNTEQQVQADPTDSLT